MARKIKSKPAIYPEEDIVIRCGKAIVEARGIEKPEIISDKTSNHRAMQTKAHGAVEITIIQSEKSSKEREHRLESNKSSKKQTASPPLRSSNTASSRRAFSFFAKPKKTK